MVETYEIPFGKGSATVKGIYCDEENAYFDIEEIIVGGVDILEELYDYCIISSYKDPTYLLDNVEKKVLALREAGAQEEKDDAMIEQHILEQDEAYCRKYI